MALEEEPDIGRAGTLSRREMIQRSIGATTALAVPGLLAACGGSSSPSASSSAGSPAGGKPRRGGHLTVAVNDGGATDVLSPWNTPFYSSGARAKQVYERLYTWSPEGLPLPQLAVSAEPDKTATVWHVKLRSGVTFHNGKTLTADDVLYSIRYVLNPKSNAEAISRIAAIDPGASRVVSPTELELHLKRPIGDTPGDLLADKALWIVPAGTTDFSKPMGTGPFIFKSWQPGVRALYERNPNYWERTSAGGPPWVDSLEFQTIVDDTARLNALLGGQVQEILNISLVQARAQASNSAVAIIRTPQPNVTPIYMEIDAPNFRDIRVRHALKLALDRNEMVNNILLGFGSIGNDLFGKGLLSYNADIPQRAHDPQQAASLLKQAGVGGLNLTLPTAEAAAGMVESATAFKQQAAAVGINVTLQKIDAGTYFTNKLYLKVPFYQTSNVDDFVGTTLDLLLPNSPYNETHWFDKRWAAEFAKAQAIVDTAQRNAAYKALQVPLWDRGGYLIWGFFETLDATSPKVHGIVPNKSRGFENLGGLYFKYHWLSA
jgi:peptide/nickel transport system substrate-binding protein